MELGLDFDDSDFVQKERPKELLTSYNARICNPEWFLQDVDDNGHTEKATLYKFRGDFHYGRCDYENATDCYSISLNSLGSHNRSMRRETTESLTRCYLYSRKFDKAKEFADKVLEDCLTRDQICQCLILKQQIHQHSGQIRDELHILYQLINLHPRNVQFWTSLKDVYNRIQQSRTSNLSNMPVPNHIDKVDTSKQLCSEIQSEKQECDTQCSLNMCTKLDGLAVVSNASRHESSVINTKSNTSEHFSMSEETGYSNNSDVLSGYDCQLLKLSCCVRLRLILKGVHNTVGSFIKDRNQQEQDKIEEEINSLGVSDEVISKATQYLKGDFTEDDDSETKSDVTEEESGKDIPSYTSEEFNRKWFSWINNS